MGVELKNIFLAFGLSALFLALVVFYFFWNLYRQQRKFRDLQFQKINAEITATEMERNRLSTELHNDIAPTLASVKMRLGLIKNQPPDLINDLDNALNNTIVQIRGIMQELTPLTIYELPFQDILKQYIDSLKIKDLIQIEFKDETDFILKSEKNNEEKYNNKIGLDIEIFDYVKKTNLDTESMYNLSMDFDIKDPKIINLSRNYIRDSMHRKFYSYNLACINI